MNLVHIPSAKAELGYRGNRARVTFNTVKNVLADGKLTSTAKILVLICYTAVIFCREPGLGLWLAILY